MVSVYKRRLCRKAAPHRLEVDDLRGFGWSFEGHEPRDLYFSGAEFFQIHIIFVL